MRLPRPPRALLLVAGGVLLVMVVLTLLGGWRTGVSTDETYHVARLRNFLEHGWYLLDSDLAGSSPGPWQEEVFVYAPVTTLLLHGWALLLGVESGGQVSSAADAYAVRHLGVALVSFVGVLATAALARLVLGGWRWGLLAAAALVAVPTWSGHAMFNVKDVAVATGYTLTTLGLVLAAGPRRDVRLLGALTLTAGLVLAVGTRPGIAAGLGVATLVALLTRDRARWVAVLGATAAATVTLWLVYPAVFDNPVEAVVRGALSSSRYDDQEGAWWYVPLFLVLELPTLHLLLGAAGTVLVARALRRVTGPARLALTLLLLQAFLLPLLGVLRQSNIYTGLRQLLFAAPALAVLVTVAVASLLAWAAGARGAADRRRPVALAVPWLAAAALALPVASQAQLFPYGYAYRSLPALAIEPAVAAQRPALEMQTDYWRTSVRELEPDVPEDEFVVCSPRRNADGDLWRFSRDGHDDCSGALVSPLSAYVDERGAPPGGTGTRWAAVVTATDQDPENCTRTAEVSRRLWFETLVMSFVAQCDLRLEDYPVDGMSFDGFGRDTQVSLGGWDLHPTRPGMGLQASSTPRSPAALGVTLPPRLQDLPLRLHGRALGAEGLRVWVNGARLRPTVDGADWSTRVPAPVAGALGEGRLVVEVADAATEPGQVPDLRLLDLALDPAPDQIGRSTR